MSTNLRELSDKELMTLYYCELDRPINSWATSLGRKLVFAEVIRRGLLTYDEVMEQINRTKE